MSSRELTPEEEVVLDLIIDQRKKSNRDDDLFIYDARLGQKKLNLNGDAAKYGIGLPQQREIIHRLSEDSRLAQDCVIDIDWITEIDPDGISHRFAHHDGDEWLDNVQKNYEISPIFFDEKSDLENFYYVSLSFEQIRNIHDGHMIKYPCELLYDDEKCYFAVVRKDNGEKYIVNDSRLKSGCPPFKVLLIAFKSKDGYAKRDDLVREHGLSQIKGKSLATQVFDDNSVVRNELAPFVKLKSDSIRVRRDAELSLSQLRGIEKSCI